MVKGQIVPQNCDPQRFSFWPMATLNLTWYLKLIYVDFSLTASSFQKRPSHGPRRSNPLASPKAPQWFPVPQMEHLSVNMLIYLTARLWGPIEYTRTPKDLGKRRTGIWLQTAKTTHHFHFDLNKMVHDICPHLCRHCEEGALMCQRFGSWKVDWRACDHCDLAG